MQNTAIFMTVKMVMDSQMFVAGFFFLLPHLIEI